MASSKGRHHVPWTGRLRSTMNGVGSWGNELECPRLRTPFEPLDRPQQHPRTNQARRLDARTGIARHFTARDERGDESTDIRRRSNCRHFAGCFARDPDTRWRAYGRSDSNVRTAWAVVEIPFLESTDSGKLPFGRVFRGHDVAGAIRVLFAGRSMRSAARDAPIAVRARRRPDISKSNHREDESPRRREGHEEGPRAGETSGAAPTRFPPPTSGRGSTVRSASVGAHRGHSRSRCAPSHHQRNESDPGREGVRGRITAPNLLESAPQA